MNLRNRTSLFLVFVSFLLFSFFLGKSIHAQEPTSTPTPTPAPDTSKEQEDLQNKINEYENKIKEAQGQQKTLSSQISVMDNQISLTELRINSTKQQITQITGDIQTTTKKIATLEASLNDLTKVLLNRIVVTYEVGTVQPFQVLLSSSNPSDFFSRLNYLKIAQEHDKKLIYTTQQAKNDYSSQKAIFENKKKKVEALKKQLENYTAQLATEKKGKQTLLEVTRNDEKRYQDLLAQARAEQAAISGILAGEGTATQVGPIKTGETISSTIAGASACSSGSHLHFEVVKDNARQNPSIYLKNTSLTFESGVEPFTPTGSWDWPLDEPIRINQEYGMTYWARLGWYNGGPHTGIDMFPKDLSVGSTARVKAIRDGTLFSGSIACGGGTLKFARVDHADGIQTYYLHIN